MRRTLSRCLVFTTILLLMSHSSSTADEPKTVSMKGKVFRSDTKQPIPHAKIILLDANKSSSKDNSVDTRADEEGNYVFDKVVPGKYTVSIRAWYKTQEEAPCQLLMAKTAEKNSIVTVSRDNTEFVQQVFIKDFSVKGKKETVKDFDFACKGMFGN